MINRPVKPGLSKDSRPGSEWVLKDIDRSVDFRKEYYKYSITIATALLAFTVSFPPVLNAVESIYLVRIAWISLGVSILCGVIAHYVWSQFFMSFRNFDNKGDRENGKSWRDRLTLIRRILELFQFLALIVGVMGIAYFASVNYQHVALHSSESPAHLNTQSQH